MSTVEIDAAPVDEVRRSRDVRHTEGVRLRTQHALDAERTDDQRNLAGQFATPPALADAIAREAIAHLPADRSLSVLEPSVGSGCFVSAVLSGPAAARVSRVCGVEVDPRFADLANTLWREDGVEIVEGDFTSLAPPPQKDRYDLCLANPPYVRHHHIDPDEKVRLRSQARAALGIEVSGLSGLYVHFVLRAHAWMRNGGVGAWLLPAEWMDTNYGASLRRYFSAEVTLLRIHHFDPADQQFEDALVSSSIVIFRRARPPSGATARLTSGSSLEMPSREVTVPVADLGREAKWGRAFRGAARVGLHTVESVVLSDLFQVRRGIVTGRNRFFIRPRAEFLALGIPEALLTPILPSVRALDGCVLTGDDDGYPLVREPLALLDFRNPLEAVRDQCPSVVAVMSSSAAREAARASVARHRNPWYAQERREPAPFVVNYMGRAKRDGVCPFRVIWNRTRAIATNNYLMLYPTGWLARRIEEEPEAGSRVRDILQEVIASEYERHGRVYGGGLFKLEPTELAGIPAGGLWEHVASQLAA